MLKMFVIYDSKGEGYGQPYCGMSTGAAIRGFTDEVNGPKDRSPAAAHPEDYTLFEIGTYDTHTGVISLYEAKKSLGVGVDFVRDDESGLSNVAALSKR